MRLLRSAVESFEAEPAIIESVRSPCPLPARDLAVFCKATFLPRASIGACRSRTSANNGLPADPPGRVEGGDGVVEGRDGADVRPQPPIPHPLDDLTQLGTIGLDNEVDSQA